MKLTLHVETDKTEQPLVYEGDDPKAAIKFIEELSDEPKLLTCHFHTEVNGEKRALVRAAKGEDAKSLLEDARAWLGEVEPTLAPKKSKSDEGETMTISKSDVGTLDVGDLK